MKTLLLATVLSAAFTPAAFATQQGGACQLEERRRAEQPAPSRDVRTATSPECLQAGDGERAETPRRRSGKRIPDAELIGTRAVL